MPVLYRRDTTGVASPSSPEPLSPSTFTDDGGVPPILPRRLSLRSSRPPSLSPPPSLVGDSRHCSRPRRESGLSRVLTHTSESSAPLPSPRSESHPLSSGEEEWSNHHVRRSSIKYGSRSRPSSLSCNPNDVGKGNLLVHPAYPVVGVDRPELRDAFIRKHSSQFPHRHDEEVMSPEEMSAGQQALEVEKLNRRLDFIRAASRSGSDFPSFRTVSTELRQLHLVPRLVTVHPLGSNETLVSTPPESPSLEAILESRQTSSSSGSCSTSSSPARAASRPASMASEGGAHGNRFSYSAIERFHRRVHSYSPASNPVTPPRRPTQRATAPQDSSAISQESQSTPVSTTSSTTRRRERHIQDAMCRLEGTKVTSGVEDRWDVVWKRIASDHSLRDEAGHVDTIEAVKHFDFTSPLASPGDPVPSSATRSRYSPSVVNPGSSWPMRRDAQDNVTQATSIASSELGSRRRPVATSSPEDDAFVATSAWHGGACDGALPTGFPFGEEESLGVSGPPRTTKDWKSSSGVGRLLSSSQHKEVTEADEQLPRPSLPSLSQTHLAHSIPTRALERIKGCSMPSEISSAHYEARVTSPSPIPCRFVRHTDHDRTDVVANSVPFRDATKSDYSFMSLIHELDSALAELTPASPSSPSTSNTVPRLRKTKAVDDLKALTGPPTASTRSSNDSGPRPSIARAYYSSHVPSEGTRRVSAPDEVSPCACQPSVDATFILSEASIGKPLALSRATASRAPVVRRRTPRTYGSPASAPVSKNVLSQATSTATRSCSEAPKTASSESTPSSGTKRQALINWAKRTVSRLRQNSYLTGCATLRRMSYAIII